MISYYKSQYFDFKSRQSAWMGRMYWRLCSYAMSWGARLKFFCGVGAMLLVSFSVISWAFLFLQQKIEGVASLALLAKASALPPGAPPEERAGEGAKEALPKEIHSALLSTLQNPSQQDWKVSAKAWYLQFKDKHPEIQSSPAFQALKSRFHNIDNLLSNVSPSQTDSFLKAVADLLPPMSQDPLHDLILNDLRLQAGSYYPLYTLAREAQERLKPVLGTGTSGSWAFPSGSREPYTQQK